MSKCVFYSYRRGKRTQHNNQILIRIEGINSCDEAARFIGKKVIWKSRQENVLRGIIVGVHGRKGALKARFQKGLPGQAVGAELTII